MTWAQIQIGVGSLTLRPKPTPMRPDHLAAVGAVLQVRWGRRLRHCRCIGGRNDSGTGRQSGQRGPAVKRALVCRSRFCWEMIMPKVVPMFLLLAGCTAATSSGVYETPVELTIPSTKTPRAFAMCAAGAFPDIGQLLNEGDHYWLTRQHQGVVVERWDFLPTRTGSIAERRSIQVFRSGSGWVRACA